MTRLAGPLAAVAAAIGVVVLLVAGVDPGELVLLAAYQAAFVIGPGMWITRVLPLENMAERYGAAWAVGTAAAAGLFLVGGALGLHAAVWLLPILTALEIRRRRRDRAPWPGVPSAIETLAVLVVGLIALALVGLVLWGPNPLGRDTTAGTPYQDLVYHLSLAGEVLHHGWPFEDPSVAGEPLRYQLLPHLDVASASFVTGVDPEVVLTRTQPFMALIAAAALTAGLGRRLGLAGAWALVPVLVLLFAGEVDVNDLGSTFGNRALLAEDLLSPTELVAVPLLLTILAALPLARPATPLPRRVVVPVWMVLGFGAMAAKVTIIPIAVAGLAFAVVLVARRRKLAVRVAVPAGALLAGAFVAYAAFYVGSNANGLEVGPLSILGGEGTSDDLKRAAFVPFVALAPAAGIVAYLVLRRPGRDDLFVWATVGMLLAAVVPYLALQHPGQSQVYFLRAGLVAAAPLAGVGLVLGLRELAAGRWRLPVALVVVVAVLVVAPESYGPNGLLTPFVVAVAIVVVAGAVLAPMAGRRFLPRAVVFIAVLTCVLSLPDAFLDREDAARAVLDGDSLVAPDGAVAGRGITRDVRTALVWLREHSDADDVVAVNNAAQGPNDFRYFHYAAIAQRRTYLEGWSYSDAAVSRGPANHAFAGREAVNAAAFTGDPRALSTLYRDHRVRFLFVDRRYGAAPARTKGLRRVYGNAQATVYRVEAP